MRTQGSARRSRAIWSCRCVSSFSRASSALRSATHCSLDTTGWFRVLTLAVVVFMVCSLTRRAIRVLRSDAHSRTSARARAQVVVLVVAAHPKSAFVPPKWRPVEPLVNAPEDVQSARIGGIGVVYDAVLEHERAQARPIARVGGRVGSACGR